jgi:hypothetical protein
MNIATKNFLLFMEIYFLEIELCSNSPEAV